MGNYKDRGIMKWAPFESLDGRQDVLEELIFNLGKKNITTLSNDALALMDENAKYAVENNKNVSITYYSDGYTYSTIGKINKIDQINKTILLDTNEKISVDDVLRLEVLND